MPVLAIAGLSKRERRRGRWSLSAKMALLAVIYLVVPVILYVQFRSAYEESQRLLLRSVRDQGLAISQSLLPWLKTVDGAKLPELSEHLSGYADEVTTVKLLLAPTGSDGFYYVASWPTVEPSNLKAERQTLARQGVLKRLAEHCRGEIPFSLIYHRPTGGAEIVTAVTPLSTAVGCWAVISSFSADAFPSAHLGEPYWATPSVRIAAAIYLAMALITFTTLLGIRSGLRRFAGRARWIRERGPDAGSFGDRANLPELADVAAEFDRMVEALHRSAANIRRAAEDNAHAFKTPIAVIRQSLEPLRRNLPGNNPRAQRALGVVESSLDRLDGLVASARRLDEATADLLAKPHVPVDLERVIGRMDQTLSAILPSRDLTISADLAGGIFVLGTEEMIETVIENLIDNAISFSSPEDEIHVRLAREGGGAHITVSDQGPGIPNEELERIFERYYSERRRDGPSPNAGRYYGIGLWIARRNVEAMGGRIYAENRVPHGLVVHVHLPPAPGRG